MLRAVLFLIVGVLMGLFFSSAFAEDRLGVLAKGGAGGWLNVSRPLTAQDFEGRLVLLDFWTYGCINCMQVVPDLEYLEKTFGDSLLVIGVHSAKFKGEREGDRILAAAKRFGLKHPVINDSDFAIWNSFGIRAWPSLVLLGPDGQELARYAGEGNRSAIEKEIRENLDANLEMKAVVSSPSSPLERQEGEKQGRLERQLSFPARVKGMGEDLLIADSGHNRLLKVGRDGKIKTVIGSGRRGFQDGDLATATFDSPRGMDAQGNKIIVADTGNHALREVDLDKGQVRTVAGTGKRGFFRPSLWGGGEEAVLASPWDVSLVPDGTGTLFVVALAGVHQLGLYDSRTEKLQVFAGNGREDIRDAAAAKAELAQPSGVFVVPGGSVYFVDAESSALRVVKDGEVKTLVGSGLFDFGHEDGPGLKARMQHPQGLYADGAGKVYIADTYNDAIRVYDVKTGVLGTVSLSGGSVREPGAIWGRAGESILYIADTNNHRIGVLDMGTGRFSVLEILK